MSDLISPHQLYQDHEEGAEVPVVQMLAARSCALELLSAVTGQKQALDHALEKSESFKALPSRDKAFCRMLVTTTIRRLGQIDDLITKVQDNPSRTSASILNILRLGAAQALWMAVADHAAVDTSVRLCEAAGMHKQKGFVNGCLRSLLRNGQEWLSRQDETRLNTPEWLLKRWIEDYGLRTAAEIARANLIEAPMDISIRDEDERNYWASQFQASEVGCGTLRKTSGGNVADFSGFDEGKWWVQDASAALPAHLFGELTGRHVIDLCAAPGGKSLQMAAQGAHVTAIDRSAKRLEKLRENAQRTRMEDRIEIIAADASAWRPKQAPDFILLDAPCSATGTVRRHPDVLHLKAERDIDHLRNVQERILQNAFDILAPGGLLVYCTCSLQKEEGENLIASFLENTPKARKIAITAAEIGDIEEAITPEGDVRIFPFHRSALGGMDGFFISRLSKL